MAYRIIARVHRWYSPDHGDDVDAILVVASGPTAAQLAGLLSGQPERHEQVAVVPRWTQPDVDDVEGFRPLANAYAGAELARDAQQDRWMAVRWYPFTEDGTEALQPPVVAYDPASFPWSNDETQQRVVPFALGVIFADLLGIRELEEVPTGWDADQAPAWQPFRPWGPDIPAEHRAEAVPPGPPTNMAAFNAGTPLHIIITWTDPTGSGTSPLASLEVFRSSISISGIQGATFVGSVAPGVESIDDYYGALDNFDGRQSIRWYVRAVNAQGLEGPALLGQFGGVGMEPDFYYNDDQRGSNAPRWFAPDAETAVIQPPAPPPPFDPTTLQHPDQPQAWRVDRWWTPERSWHPVALGAGPAPSVGGLPHVEYVVEILDSSATFGPNAKLGELWDLRNLGWSSYDRIPGKAFFTLSQRSDMLGLIEPLTTHIRIWRLTPNLTTLVYTGAIIDYDATGDDVVFSAFDYKALLSISRSGYRTMYATKAIGSEIVSPEWVLAKVATSSPLGFVATGTIEDPLGTDGTTVIKTNNQFGLLDQMRLQLFFDLSEIGRANTVNHTTFDITRSLTPTFEFRKNRGVNIDMGLVLNGNVSDYRHLPNWTSYRNDLATIGTTVGGGATEVVVKDDTAATARGRRQDVFTIKTLLGIAGAATTADQQQAASQRMLKTGLTLQPTLQLKMIRGGVDFFNGWDLCDKPIVEIDNGVDSISERWRILGARATFDEAGEAPSLIVSPVAV